MRRKLILLTAFVSLFLAGCESKPEGMGMEMPAVPVTAAPPTIQDVTLYMDSIGILKPSILMEIRPQVEGTLVEVLGKEGQWVEAGTPLFKIDSKLYAIKVQEAEAQVAISRANLEAAQKKLNRNKPLALKDFVSQAEWEALETEVEKSQASLLLDEARLNSAKLDLDDCMLCTPTAGRIGKFDAHPGLHVAKGDTEPLTTVSQMDPLIVEFSVTEKEFPQIEQELQEIEIKSLCNGEVCAKGSITFLDNHFDPETGLLLIRGTVKNPAYKLRPGQSVHVKVPVTVTKNATIIPQKAIRYNREGPYIYVIQPDKTVAVRQLILGEEQGSDQVVLEGLEPEEQFIIDGHLRLSPGAKVEVNP